jgi:hypothetical protein
MSSNKILKTLNSNLLKIWVLHIFIYYPICGFLAENLQKGKLNFKDNLDPIH